MSAIKRLREANSLSDVAHILGFKPSAVSYLIRKMPADQRYSKFEIDKRSGGKRLICAPNKRLRLLQQRLAKHLTLCESEIHEIRKVKTPLAHGFRKDHSIMSNADRHRSRRFVLNIDLKDFFGTINFGRVRGYFISNKDFRLDPCVATVLAQIACHENSLPQGSPCSPVLSNLIGNILDIRASKLARARGCSYTRYADDLTFSTSKRDFPAELATGQVGSEHRWQVGAALQEVVSKCGFSINEKKTRVQYQRSRQDVTGLVVNKNVNTKLEYRRTVRAMVHRFCSTGVFALPGKHGSDEATGERKLKEGTPAQLHGMLSFIDQVDQWRINRDQHRTQDLSANEKLFRKFIFYNEFAAARQPTVIFEGKTDSIYLREALRNNPTAHPRLATGEGKSFKLLIRLQRQSKLATRLFGLSSGSCPLKDFIREYRERYRALAGPKGTHPVIALLDNDSGFTPVKTLLRDRFKLELKAGEQYIRVTDNLYVLLSSPYHSNEKNTHCIEDCFDEDTKSIKLGSKSLSLKNDFDAGTSYGKAWFAERVVKPRAKDIDFTGFDELLSQISAILGSHS